jgi:uncharacterized protein
MDISAKRELILEKLRARGSIVIAFSGGVDSSLLAVLAKAALGAKSRCVLLDSPVVPRQAIAEAREIARRHGLPFEIIPVRILADEQFRANPSERCYWCKKNSAAVLAKRATELGFACIADGMNVSDTGEHRPGLRASTEEGIVHPFIEAGITKADIRAIAREMNLEFSDKPSAACLSSRIPYGDEITVDKLHMVEEAEAFLHGAGFSQVRVRMHKKIARIELPEAEMQKLLAMHGDVTSTLKSIGFLYVTLDIEGYRSGSMDEVL